MATAERKLPDFLIPGEPRCGTTALYTHFSEHPSVFMSERKELRFFTENWERGVGWYAGHFAQATPGQVVGEASPDYVFRRAGERIAQTLPGVRSIIILREPVARAWSTYWWRRSRGVEKRSFEQVVDDAEREDGDDFIAASRYSEQLEDFTRWLPRDSVEVVLLDQLKGAPVETFARLCRFIGVDDSFAPPGLTRSINSPTHTRSRFLKRVALKLPGSLGTALTSFNTTRFETPSMSPQMAERLHAYFAPWNERLAADWIELPESWSTPRIG